MLYVRTDLHGTPVQELPVAIVRGGLGRTTITDGRASLAKDHYQVETLSVAKPGDVDRDGVDDLTELADPKRFNPLNAAPGMKLAIGAVFIPDHATYQTLSYQGDEVARGRVYRQP